MRETLRAVGLNEFVKRLRSFDAQRERAAYLSKNYVAPELAMKISVLRLHPFISPLHANLINP